MVITHHMSIVRVLILYWGWKSLRFIVKFIFMEIFFIILILQHSRCENTLWSREHLRNISRIFLRYFLLFSVILARIFQIPYCFNILSLIISVFLLLNANKCFCYSVKWSAVIQLFLSNMEKWIPILTVWLRASQQGDQRVLTHTLSQ